MTAPVDLSTAEPEDLLIMGAAELGLALKPAVRRQFLFYAAELLKWNTRINLTGLRTAQEVVVKHFLDSLAVWPWVEEVGPLADIGTGAGFPGLALKLALPELQLTLVEPTGKKATFLKYISAQLGLTGVEVRQVFLTAAIARDWGPQFQAVITRATFALARYLELGAPLVTSGGRLLALKGPRLAEEEWREAVARTAGQGLQPPVRYDYLLPVTREPRLLVVWQKQGGSRESRPGLAGEFVLEA